MHTKARTKMSSLKDSSTQSVIHSSTRRATSNPANSSIRTSSSASISGWIFDLYPSPHGMTLWLISPNQTRHRLIDHFTPSFYVSGPDTVLHRLQGEAARQPHALVCRPTERMDLWEQRARPVLEIEVAHPNEFNSWTR